MFEKRVKQIYVSEDNRKRFLEILEAADSSEKMLKELKVIAAYGVQGTLLFSANFFMLSVIGATWIESWIPLVSNIFLIPAVWFGLFVTYTAEMTLRVYNESVATVS